jgi:hypothetical protein
MKFKKVPQNIYDTFLQILGHMWSKNKKYKLKMHVSYTTSNYTDSAYVKFAIKPLLISC